MTTTLLLVTVILLLVWLFLRQRQRKPEVSQDRRTSSQENTGEFHAVAIRFPENACVAAKQLAGERFLASDPPDIPLPGCDNARCACYFAHYDDRRKGFDRRSPFSPNTGQTGSGYYERERRQGTERRNKS